MLLSIKYCQRFLGLCFLSFAIAGPLHSAEKNKRLYFNHLSIAEGLSNLHVIDIMQDKDGFLWFGTENGLNRYDGISFKVYKNNPKDQESLSGSSVNCLFSDSKGRCWIGTTQGLSLYNPGNDKFHNFQDIPIFHQNNIRCIFEDRNHLLWIGSRLGLIRFNPDTNEANVYNKGNSGLSHNMVRAVYEDPNENLWVGTFNGLNCFDKKTGKCKQIKPVNAYPGDPDNNLILSIVSSDTDSLLYIGTETGLCLFNTSTHQSKVYRKENTPGISNNVIKDINRTGKDQLWLGTDAGLVICKNGTFHSLQYNPFINNGLPNNVIWKIFKDDSGIIWLATNNGIAKYNPRNNEFIFTSLVSFVEPRYYGLNIYSMAFDDRKGCWLATQHGLAYYMPEEKEIKWINNLPAGTPNVYRNLFLDKYKNLWIGSSEGILCFDTRNSKYADLNKYNIPKTKYNNCMAMVNDSVFWVGDFFGNLIQYRLKYTKGILAGIETDSYFVDSGIWGMTVDDQDHVWIISKKGLLKFIPETNTFKDFYNSALGNTIGNIYGDIKKRIWCTTDEGLYVYNNQQNTFDKILEGNDFAISKIKDDLHGNLWIANKKGILKYEPENHSLSHHDLSFYRNFLQSINISAERDLAGNIYFSGTDGFLFFNPDSIYVKASDYPLYITDIKLFSKSLTINENGLSQQAYLTKRITLPHNKNVISFSFSMLDYTSPELIKYEYFLENFDKGWIWTSDLNNQAIYSNLPPGEYVFRVKATNADGIFNQREAEVWLKILPPWWKTWWAMLLYIIIAGISAYLIHKQRESKIKLKSDLEKEKLEREKTEEVNQIKLRFFTNISHEFRTPLSLILGPLDNMLAEKPDEKNQKRLLLIRQNAERLLRLINQIIDFRKIENQKMTINLKSGDLISFSKNIFNSFIELAEKKGIFLHFNTMETELNTLFDHDKMDKILFNLLSNAMKFTSEQGEIALSILVSGDEITIEVKDTGIGIPEKDIIHIFDRFYQVKEHAALEANSSGIGLTLVKEFVELHGGDLQVRSTEKIGSCFVITLPYRRAEEGEMNNEINENTIEETEEKVSIPGKSGLPVILLVEDNEEMREYIISELSDTFNILTASDGEKGLALANKENPELIVSDVMMPVMDGFELCKRLKTEFATSHMPIILLTAKAGEESVIEGYSVGADAYIGKPFSIKILRSLITNLIQQRKTIKDSLRRSIIMTPKAYDKQSPDEIFLAKAVALIEKKISDPDLNIQQLCDELGITHIQLYRKLKALVGQNINEFIRTIRLKKAAQLLSVKGLNVTEVLYEVGFNSRSYFSKCFKDEYGVFPKEYAKQQQGGNIEEESEK